jgi:hypothetical protein
VSASPHSIRPPGFRRAIGTLAIVALLVMVVACGTQFTYNRLGWLAHYYLSNQVELDGSQSNALRANLREFFVWHRSHELPRYADFLDRFAAAAAEPLSREQLAAGRGEIEGFVSTSVAQGAPDAARWLRGLRAEQIDELFASFEEKERESRQENCGVDPGKRRARSTARFIKNVEDWTGKLSGAQRELIGSRLAKTGGDPCLDLSARERARKEFRELVDQHRHDADFARRIAQFMTRPEERRDPEYRQTYEANREIILDLMTDLNHTMTPEQRRRSIEKLRGFARELKALSMDLEKT